MKWEEYTSNDILDIRDGTHDSPKYIEKGYPLITSKNLIDGELSFADVNYISEEDYNQINKRSKVDRGDVLYSMIGSIGNYAMIKEEPHFAIKNVALFKFNNDILDRMFFLHLINSSIINRQIEEKQRGGTQKFVSLKILRNLQIPLPPLPVQQKIATILDTADALKQKDKALIAKYDELTQSLFLDMFGDPVANTRGWKVKTLKEITTNILSGTTPKGGKKVYVEEGITFFRSQNVWRKKILLDDVAYIDDETHLKMKKSSLHYKDILMTKTGRINTENSSLGRAALFLGPNNSANINGHVYLIRLQTEMVHEFILYILTTNEYREHIRRVCVGGIDKRQINKEHLEEFPIISPPINLQKQFAKCFKVIEQQKQQAQASLKKSEDLFNCLLQKAFKGELVS
jgi:type I restriction enzyme, S subunit